MCARQGLVYAGNHLNQRAFPAAILTCETLYFTWEKLEGNVLQRFDATERHADVFERKDRHELMPRRRLESHCCLPFCFTPALSVGMPGPRLLGIPDRRVLETERSEFVDRIDRDRLQCIDDNVSFFLVDTATTETFNGHAVGD